jgi:hypothetical protein
MEPNQPQWQGPERRRLKAPFVGRDRRRPRPAGYRNDGTPGVNAPEPATEREERELTHKEGPDPRIPR